MNSYLDGIKNSVVLGKNGSGKTTGFLFNEIENYILKGDNLLINDSKKEYYNNYLKLLKMKGYKIVCINLDDAIRSDNYNPLLGAYEEYKSGNTDGSIGMLENLSSYLFGSDDSVQDLFIATSLIMFKEFSLDEINIGTIGAIIETVHDYDIKYYINGLDVYNPIAVLLKRLISSDTFNQVLDKMRKKLNYLMIRGNMLNMLSGDENIINNRDEKLAVFIFNTNTDERANIIPFIIDEYIIKARNDKRMYDLILDNADHLNKISLLERIVELDLPNINFVFGISDIMKLKKYYKLETLKEFTLFNISNNKVRFKDKEYEINYIYDKKFISELPFCEKKLSIGDVNKLFR